MLGRDIGVALLRTSELSNPFGGRRQAPFLPPKQTRKAMTQRHKTTANTRVSPATTRRGRPWLSKEGMFFASGIENSNPTINNGRIRIDEMHSCGRYEHWSTDFDKVQEMGISFLRYGPPLHTSFLGPDRTATIGPLQTRFSPTFRCRQSPDWRWQSGCQTRPELACFGARCRSASGG
jgi:hypothetical protein